MRMCAPTNSMHKQLFEFMIQRATLTCHYFVRKYFFKKWANPGLFFIYFWSFQTNINTIFTIQCEKMSCPSSIRCRDSNPHPPDHESSPITTRPGLPPLVRQYYSSWYSPTTNNTKLRKAEFKSGPDPVESCLQSYKASTSVNCDCRVLFTIKLVIFMTLET